MPQPRRLDADDYPAASAWLASHGFDGVLPVDAPLHLDGDAWRALKAHVRASRRLGRVSGSAGLDELLQEVQAIGNTLIGGSRNLTREQAGKRLLESLAEYQASRSVR